MTEEKRRAGTVIGWAAYGSIAVGVLAVGGALFAASQFAWTAAGVNLLAAAVAFGLLANAVLG